MTVDLDRGEIGTLLDLCEDAEAQADELGNEEDSALYQALRLKLAGAFQK